MGWSSVQEALLIEGVIVSKLILTQNRLRALIYESYIESCLYCFGSVREIKAQLIGNGILQFYLLFVASVHTMRCRWTYVITQFPVRLPKSSEMPELFRIWAVELRGQMWRRTNVTSWLLWTSIFLQFTCHPTQRKVETQSKWIRDPPCCMLHRYILISFT
jgi:hypothetical protein